MLVSLNLVICIFITVINRFWRRLISHLPASYWIPSVKEQSPCTTTSAITVFFFNIKIKLSTQIVIKLQKFELIWFFSASSINMEIDLWDIYQHKFCQHSVRWFSFEIVDIFSNIRKKMLFENRRIQNHQFPWRTQIISHERNSICFMSRSYFVGLFD